ncbi:MAG: Ig family protein, partial [Acidobacteriia bacterium]|nr:Ig family protein [Terriglobia bacterium]
MLFYLAAGVTAHAQSFTTLVNFNGANGSSPYGPVIQGTDGNLYGTTSGGGANGQGTVFQLTPAGTVNTIHSFNGADGASPQAGLVLGTDGNFYGTTSGSGSTPGTVFKITSSGALTSLFVFGAGAGRGLIQASDGNFYGTIVSNAGSTIFKITPAGMFTSLAQLSVVPASGLVQGTDGNFYGTTQGGTINGSNYGNGTVFKMTPGGAL